MSRHRTVHTPLSPLYVRDYAGYLADQFIFTGRQRGSVEDTRNPWQYLTPADVARFEDQIRAARHDGKITQREADNLLTELHGGDGTHRAPHHFYKKQHRQGR